MSALRRFCLRLLSFFRPRAADDELAREISSHLQLLEDQFVAGGMTVQDARFAARRTFGGVDQARLQQRDARSFRVLDDSWLDFKLGARMLVKYPGLSLVGGAALAVAIGFGAAFFAFFYSYIYPTIPLPEGDRLVALENLDLTRNNEERQSLHDFVSWRDELTTVQEVGAFRTIGRNLIIPGGAAEPIRIAEITVAGFAAARVPPLVGRPFVAEDERYDAPAVLMIGYDVWTTRFASDASIVGREVRIGNTPYTIIGIMPNQFGFPVNHSYWAPLRLDPARYARGAGPEIFVFGRLAPGITMARAQQELAAIGARAASTFPATNAQLRPQVMPYTYPIEDIQGVTSWQFAVMQGVVSLLLVIVAVNVAILIYARTATRQGEIAVRTALGASRRRVVGQLFVEALVLSALAAALGLALATVGLSQGHLIMQLEGGARAPFWMTYGLPPLTIAYVIALAVLGAMIAGVLPAIHATGRAVQSTLQRLAGHSHLHLGKTWTVMIVAQVAFAVAVLPTAAAMAWHEIQFATSKPMFAVEQFLRLGLAPDPEPPPDADPATYVRDSAARLAAIQSDFTARLEAESWATDVTVAERVPGDESDSRLEVEERPAPTGSTGHEVRVNRVAFDYFDAFDARILTGRGFNSGDVDGVIVNRTFVEKVLGDGEALGRRVRHVDPSTTNRDENARESWQEIIGVVSDLHSNTISPESRTAEVYHPMASWQGQPSSVIVRVRGEQAEDHIGRVREIASEIDPTLRLSAYPLVQLYRQQNVALRLVAFAVGLIVVTVLLLSAAGIYAMMSFAVVQRRREIGIRAALGADPGELLRSIFARAVTQVAIGVAVGIVAVAAIDRLSGGELMFGLDAILLPIVALLMLATGLLATLGPARRGLRIQPTQALREQ